MWRKQRSGMSRGLPEAWIWANRYLAVTAVAEVKCLDDSARTCKYGARVRPAISEQFDLMAIFASQGHFKPSRTWRRGARGDITVSTGVEEVPYPPRSGAKDVFQLILMSTAIAGAASRSKLIRAWRL